MLKLFTEAFGEFLTAKLSDLPEKPVVSFALPGAVAGQNAVNIFLTSLRENAGLRSNEQQYKREGPGWVATIPPLRVTCTYIVSAWPCAEDPTEAALSQQQLLGAAYTAIASAGSLPAAFIPAPMNTADLPAPIIAISNDELHQNPEFWTSAGCKFRPAFSFSAAVALPLSDGRFDYGVGEDGVKIGYRVNS